MGCKMIDLFVCFGEEKLEESSQQVQHGHHMWEQHGVNLLLDYEQQRQSPQQAPQLHHGGNGFFHPLDAAAEPILQIGKIPKEVSHKWKSQRDTPNGRASLHQDRQNGIKVQGCPYWTGSHKSCTEWGGCKEGGRSVVATSPPSARRPALRAPSITMMNMTITRMNMTTTIAILRTARHPGCRHTSSLSCSHCASVTVFRDRGRHAAFSRPHTAFSSTRPWPRSSCHCRRHGAAMVAV